MKAYWIKPEDIGAADEWSDRWKIFIEKLGYDPKNPPYSILLMPIETTN